MLETLIPAAPEDRGRRFDDPRTIVISHDQDRALHVGFHLELAQRTSRGVRSLASVPAAAAR